LFPCDGRDISRVFSPEYQGAYVKMTLKRPGYEDFVVNLSDRDFFTQQMGIGDRVIARWTTEDTHLLQGGLDPEGEHTVAGRQ
jgi:hypothetical protein